MPRTSQIDPELLRGSTGPYNLLLHLTQTEDDRGVVLSMLAFAEQQLGLLIAAYLRLGRSATDLLDGFNAPLGTLSARIKACHALGLINDAQYSDLEAARKIRNVFAHDWENPSFESETVVPLLKKLHRSPMPDDLRDRDTPRAIFRDSVTWVLMELEVLTDEIGKRKMRLPSLALKLVPGTPYRPEANKSSQADDSTPPPASPNTTEGKSAA